MSMTPTPGQPLSEADVSLLQPGDWLLCHESEERFEPKITAGTLAQFIRPCGSGGVSNCIVTSFHPSFGFRPRRFTFLGRPDQDGWIAWSGGENPVPGVRVEVVLRAEEGTGLHEPAEPSDDYRWTHLKASGLDGNGDIIAYRPHAPVSRPGDGVEGRGEILARRFHEAYERLAPSFGYETREETRAFDPVTPNGRLMIAVCSELAALTPPAEPVSRPAGEGEREAVARITGDDLHEILASFEDRADVGEIAAKINERLSLLSPAAPDAGGGWMPIETAPQDGTEFQGWVAGQWEPRCRHDPETGALEVWGRVDYDEDGWAVYPHAETTHWMPSPACPALQPGGER